MTETVEARVRGMSDAELASFEAAVLAERAARERRRKEDAIAKIRALAGEAGIPVTIGGARGRPGTPRPAKSRGKPESAA